MKIKDPKIWYDNSPIGQNTLDVYMKKMLELGGLSQICTNHCIHKTTVTMLDQNRFHPKDIMTVTGHRSVVALMAYMSKPTLERRQNMSRALHAYGRSQSQSQSHVAATEVPCLASRSGNSRGRASAPAALGAPPSVEGRHPRHAVASASAQEVSCLADRYVSTPARRSAPAALGAPPPSQGLGHQRQASAADPAVLGGNSSDVNVGHGTASSTVNA